MAGLLTGFQDPQTLGLLGFATGLMKGSGPSRMPVGLGSAMGEGFQGGILGLQQGQQMQLMREKAEAERQQREGIERFGQSLPENERLRFMANPEAYIRATTPKPEGPYTLTPGAVRFGPDGKPIASVPTKPDQPSALAQLIQERDALPPDSPLRQIYDQAINRQATHAPAANIVNAPVIT